MTVADRIRRRREELKLTQEELAARLGYASKSAVSRTENAGDNVGQKRIKMFAEALNTSPAELIGWDEPVPDLRVNTQPQPETVQKYLALPEELKRQADEYIDFLYKKSPDYIEKEIRKELAKDVEEEAG